MNEKKYSLLNNVFFLLRMIRKYLPMSFVFVIIDIPLAVFMDYVGVRICWNDSGILGVSWNGCGAWYC